MKVFNREGKDFMTVKSELNGANVLRKLILKAEKRKTYAENFHIYAVLQSTISRLKSDSKLLKVTKVPHNFKIGKSLKDGLNQSSISCAQNSFVKIHHDHDDKDPLNLDSFFEKLNNR